jgi:ABC-type nickel/cobalt efflux system permease component RcnA
MKKPEPQRVLNTMKERFDVRAFYMGFAKGFVLCPPFFALLSFCFISFLQINPALLVVFFDLGTEVSSLLFLAE